MKKKFTPLIAVAALAALAVGTNTFAQDGVDEGEEPPSEPGIPYADPNPGDGLPESGVPETIITGGSSYDPTLLTTFIPGAWFNPKQGDPGLDDTVAYTGGVGVAQACVSAAAASGGVSTEFYYGLGLPDGALIKQVVFYGEDNDAADITVQLGRTTVRVPFILGAPTRTDTAITTFNTSAVSGVVAVASANNLDEVAGSLSAGILTGVDHRFHTINVRLVNAAGGNHRLCGVEVRYQVPAGSVEAPTFSSDPGTTFYPIDPIRAYDGRVAAYPESGMLAPNTAKTISIKDSHDGAGTVIAADVVPPEATAIAYNITIAEPTANNFVAVTPGGAAGFTTSAINFNGTADIANAGTVSINANRQITVWGGDQPGSMFVLIDVTGYYAPPPALTAPEVVFPNMGN